MELFALGGAKRDAAQLDVGYWASRALLAKLAAEASLYLVERGVGQATGSLAARFAAEIAARYGLVVSEKVAAGSIPLIGAIGGATVNVLFMDQLQKIAKGHFIARRLERSYARRDVERAYSEFARKLTAKA